MKEVILKLESLHPVKVSPHMPGYAAHLRELTEARQVYADLLEDEGRTALADAERWLAAAGHRLYYFPPQWTWVGMFGSERSAGDDPRPLPEDVWRHLTSGSLWGVLESATMRDYDTYDQAMEDLARALQLTGRIS